MSRKDTKLRVGLTDPGKMVLRGIAFVALAALIVPAFGVLSALLSFFLIALVVGFVLRPRIRISGYFPDRIIVNQPVQLRYLLKNIGTFPAYNLYLRYDSLPESIEQLADGLSISRLGPDETVEVTITIRPKHRGYYQIGQPVCQSCFPFGLFSFGVLSDDKEKLVVLPAFSSLRILQRHWNQKVSSDSSVLAGRTGAFPEYAGNRPFLPGDSLRKIDARAWARLAVPATKEYHENYDNCTAIVLDTGLPKSLLPLKSGRSEEFEAAVSLCASAAYTINDYCLIDMFLAGRDLHLFTDWPRRMRLDRIHEILAGVEPSEDSVREHIASILVDHLHRISDVIFVLYGWNQTHKRLLELADHARCHSTIFVIGRPDEIELDRYEYARADKIEIVSPDEVLTGQVINS